MLKFSLNFLNKNKSAPAEPTPIKAPQEQTGLYIPPTSFAKPATMQPSNPAPVNNLIEKHQAVLKHFNSLIQVGHSQQVVQQQWQKYYSQLTPEEKEHIWRATKSPQPQQASNLPAQPHNQNVNNFNQPLNSYPPANNTQSELPKKKSILDSILIPIANFPGNLKFGRKRQVNPQASPAQNAQNPMNAPTQMSTPNSNQMTASNQNIAEVLPDNLGNKTRNMFTWNSSTALFDAEESKSIWHQNIKSLVFGLTVGVICLVVWQFTFFNERYLQPFIRPSSLTSDVQIIISPDDVEVDDPTFKIIIPKLKVEAPVVAGIESYRSIDKDEPEADFEERVQKALRSGTVHYPTTQFPGQSGMNFNSNVVVLGHSGGNTWAPGNYKHVFSKLKEVELNDLILVNYENKQYIYKVWDKKIVKPTQVEVLKPGNHNNTLTIITCDPPGTIQNRLVVSARQINPDPLNNTDVEFNSSQQETVVPGDSQSLSDAFR